MLKTAFALLLLTTAPAMAFDRQFLGTWAPDAPSCDKDGNEWFKVTPKSLVEREGVCSLKGAAPAGAGWRMNFTCQGDGEEGSEPLDLIWQMGANGHLLEQMKGQSKDYIRCGATQATALPTEPATSGDDFAGQYTRAAGSYKWHATIAPKGKQTYNISVGVSSSMPECSGSLDAVGRLQGGRIVTDDECVLVISKRGSGINVEEKPGCQDHGLACPFDSVMKKVGK